MVKLLGIAWTRIRTNMRDPLIRRNVAFFMGGKLIGLALVLVAMWVFLPSVVHAMNRDPEREKRSSRQLRTHNRANPFGPIDDEIGSRKSLLQLVSNLIRRTERRSN